jgi:hypothetical protein
VKIALNLAEDRVAAVILANYPVFVDEPTLEYALRFHCLAFIHNMFIFEKIDIHCNNAANSKQDNNSEEVKQE